MSVYELTGDGDGRSALINQMERDDVKRNEIAITTTSMAITEPKTANNGILLQSGSHGGARLSADRTVINALPGANITMPVEIDSTCRLVGIRFHSNSDSIPVVVTSATVTVTFIGCEFEKTNIKGNPSFVKIADGAKAHFIGCSFYPAVTVAGDVIENVIGNAANVNVVACSNVTGQSIGNVQAAPISVTT
tara:strand:+ start:1022 stop:1597 length:576 start_codon:yes stop_codon:yes gene_type:complete